jgi:uncharacterized protein (TIGR00251 family)
VIQLEDTAEGTIIHIRAQPGARKNSIVGEHDGALKVAVTAPSDKGRANEAIIALLAEAFSLPKSAIQLVSGPTSRQKRFLLGGLVPSEIERVISALLQV